MPRPKFLVEVRCLGPYGEHTFRRPPGSTQRICNRCRERLSGSHGQLWRGLESCYSYVDTRSLVTTNGKRKRPSKGPSQEGDQ